jgi:hypothetical protein
MLNGRVNGYSLPDPTAAFAFFHRLGGHTALFEACSVFIFIMVYVLADLAKPDLLHQSASPSAVTSCRRSDCFRLEQQLPGGISSSHWINRPFHGARWFVAYRPAAGFSPSRR